MTEVLGYPTTCTKTFNKIKSMFMSFKFDDCPDSENDEELETSSMAQVPPVQMYKIEVLDSWKSARGQVYL